MAKCQKCDELALFSMFKNMPERCVNHKGPNDSLEYRLCCHPTCDKTKPKYCTLDGRKYCVAHAPIEHYQTATITKCEIKDCYQLPVFSTTNGKPLRCVYHRAHGDEYALAGRGCCYVEDGVKCPILKVHTHDSNGFHWCETHKGSHDQPGRGVLCVVCKKVRAVCVELIDKEQKTAQPTHCSKCANKNLSDFRDIVNSCVCVKCHKVRGTFINEKQEPVCQACLGDGQSIGRTNVSLCKIHPNEQLRTVIEADGTVISKCKKCKQDSDRYATPMCRACHNNPATHGDAFGHRHYCEACAPAGAINAGRKYCMRCLALRQIGIEAKKIGKLQEILDATKYEQDKLAIANGEMHESTYGFYIGDRRWCGMHAPSGAFDTVNHRCTDCEKVAKYGVDKAIHCRNHRVDGEKNLKDAMCLLCDTVASYGDKGERPMYCIIHKPESFIDVRSTFCIHVLDNGMQCKKQALFGIHKTRMFCSIHNYEQYPILFKDTCPQCHLHRVKHLCRDCRRQNGEVIETREMIVKDALVAKYGTSTITHDMSLGPSKKRPDFSILTSIGVTIIIEVDEMQHMCYEYEDELQRITKIWDDIHNSPLWVIRWNPDEYVTELGEFDSIYTYEDHLIQPYAADRVNKLIEKVEYCMTNDPPDGFKIEYMFYDE